VVVYKYVYKSPVVNEIAVHYITRKLKESNEINIKHYRLGIFNFTIHTNGITQLYHMQNFTEHLYHQKCY